MSQILAIAYNYVYISLRTPITILMAFVMPIVFTAVLGAAFSGFGDETDSRSAILLVDEDGGQLASEVRSVLERSEVLRLYTDSSDDPLPTSRQVALDALSTYQRVLILPTNFSDRVLAGTAITAEFHVEDNDPTNMAAEQEIAFILDEVSNAAGSAKMATEQAALLKPFATPDEEAAYFAEMLSRAQEELAKRPISVVSVTAMTGIDTDETQIPEGTQQSSPGNLVMFGMITLLSAAIVLVEERTDGTLRRLVVSPLKKATILAGKTLGPLSVGLIQMVILILVGQFVFGVPWGRSPVALLIMVLSFDLAIVSLGILLSTVVRNTNQAVAVMIMASMAMAALGGAWWPMEIVPPFMKTLGHFFPSAWAMDGFTNIIVRGVGVSGILLPATVLLGYAVVFFVLGIWRFRYE